MKKAFVLILILCLIIGISVPAMAAKPKISEQPESATTNEKGTVTFSIKASNIEGLTWRFVNPETGEELTGKTLPKKIKGVTVEGANKKTIKLKNVPEEMHGWTVYCHITGSGYKVDSERVTLLVYGMGDAPAAPADTAPDTDTGSDTETGSNTESGLDTETVTDVETVTTPDDGTTETTAAPADTAVTPAEPESTSFTVQGENVIICPVDAYGNRMEEEAGTVLTFEESASIAVKADGNVRYWLVNGIRVEPAASLSEFTLRDVSKDLTISAVLSGSAVESEDTVVQITCEGCTFTYGKGNLKNMTEGKVPAGAAIIIAADGGNAPKKGFSINGGSFEHVGEASFRLIVREDTAIKAQ